MLVLACLRKHALTRKQQKIKGRRTFRKPKTIEPARIIEARKVREAIFLDLKNRRSPRVSTEA